MIILIAIAALATALAFRLLHRRTFNPATIFLGVLGIQFLAYGALVGTRYALPPDETLVAFGGGLFGFFAGYGLTLAFLWPVASPWIRRRQAFGHLAPRQASRLLSIALVASLIAVFWHMLVGLDNLGQGGTGIAPLDLRTAYLANLGSFSLAPHVAIFAQFLLLFLYLHDHRPRLVMTLFLSTSVFCAMWKMERSAVMMAILAALVAYDAKRGTIPFTKLLLASAAIMAAFVATAMLRDGWDSLDDILLVMLDYFAKNLENFSTYVVGLPHTWEAELLLGKYAQVFGAPEAGINLGQDSFFNTYTYLKSVYLYGGAWFSAVFTYAIGTVFALFYVLAARRHSTMMTLYCFVSFVLFISFFEYAYSWTNWAYYAIAAAVMHVVLGTSKDVGGSYGRALPGRPRRVGSA